MPPNPLSLLSARGGPKPRATKSSLIHWLLFLALLGLQFALFLRYAEREIVWAYPRHCDQAVYLERAYETHLHMVHDGFWRGLAYGAGFNGGDPSPNGALTHLQAALLFYLAGPSRMAALTLLFIYFAAFQAMLFSTLHAVSGRWSVAWAGLGLLLTARTTFQETGGIMDFRGDWPAMCLFGIFLCCVLRSNIFQRPSWSLASGVFAALTMAARFITLAYFIPIFALTFLLLAFYRLRSSRRIPEVVEGRTEPPATHNARLRNLILSGVLGSAVIGPVLLHHEHAISNYYIRLHATGQERYERAAMYHVMQWGDSLKYYPQSLFLHHLGLAFVGLAVALLAAGAIVAAGSRAAADGFDKLTAGKLRTAPSITIGTDRRLAVAFTLIALLVPLAALNWDVDKGPSVGDIMVPPILWLVMLLAPFPLRMLQAHGQSSTLAHGTQTSMHGKGASRSGIAWPAMAIVAGIAVQVVSYLQRSDLSRHRLQAMSVVAMYDAIAASAQQNGWTDPVVADDAFTEYQFAPTIDVTVYERHGRLIHAHEALANGLLARSRQQISDAVASADFVLLSDPVRKNDELDGLVRSTQAAHDELLGYCRSHLNYLCDCPAVERHITVFVRQTDSDSAADQIRGGAASRLPAQP